MPLRVYLFRHGRSVANETAGYVWGRCVGSPLVERGVLEALRLGTCLRHAKLAPERIFSSPTVRARRTAELAMAHAAAYPQIVEDERLHEQDVGQWAGRPAAEVFTAACLNRIERDGKDFRPPGGESMNDAGRRMLGWLEDQACGPNATIYAFTHGGAIRALASVLDNLSHAQAYAIRPANGSVSLVRQGKDRSWRFAYLGIDPSYVFRQ